MGMLPTSGMINFTDLPLSEVDNEKSPQLMAEESVNYWTKQADKLPDADKALLLAQVKRSARTIFLRIESLHQAKYSADDIRKNIQQSVTLLNHSAQSFYESKQEYIQRQKLVNEKNNAIQADINALQPKPALIFNPLEEMPIYQLLLKAHSLKESEETKKQAKKELVQISQLQARTLALGVEIATLPITGVVGAVNHAQETLCQSHPDVQDTCQQISAFATQTIEVASELIPDIVKKRFNKVKGGMQKSVEKQVLYNEREFGIPRKKTEQFAQDITEIGSVVLASGTYQVIKKVVKIKTTAQEPVKVFVEETVSLPDPVPNSSTTADSFSSVCVKQAITAEKRALAQDKYVATIAKEKSFFDVLKMNKPSNLPLDFPAHSNKFHSSSRLFEFTRKNVGPSKKEWIKDQVLYQPLNHPDKDAALFLLSKRGARLEKTSSSGLYAAEKTEAKLKAIFDFSQEQGFKRLFLAWDSNHSAVISNLPANRVTILSLGHFSDGLTSKPFDLLEILINE